jgi:bile acid-coenzyme A ligase
VVAAEDPDRPAVTGWEPDGTQRTVTRAELDVQTNRIARAWAAMGIGEGD